LHRPSGTLDEFAIRREKIGTIASEQRNEWKGVAGETVPEHLLDEFIWLTTVFLTKEGLK
jgi:hypothetical protein